MNAPEVQQQAVDFWMALYQFALAVDHAGWPAVVALIAACGLVVVAAIYAAPSIGNAIAIARSGTSQRERALEIKVARLETQIANMQHQLEEQARVFGLLTKHLEGVDGVDMDTLSRIFMPPPAPAAAATRA